jgi:hypothetical protein
MPREIITTLRTDAGSDFKAIMYFEEGALTSSIRAAVAGFWGDVSAALTDSTVWDVDHESRLLDNETGALISLDVDATNYTGTGDNNLDPVPDASQGLIRWATGVVVNGRFLQGRTFIPGIASSFCLNGNLSSSTQAALATAATTFIAAAPTFGVWHRPKRDPITHVIVRTGAFWPASVGSAWNELAVLRRRRR